MKNSAILLSLVLSFVQLYQTDGFSSIRFFPRTYQITNKQCFKASSSDLDSLIQKVKSNSKDKKLVVIKYGGHAMENDELKEKFLDDIAILSQQLSILPVIVHGGGPQIASMLKRLNVQSQFVDGLRVTDEATMEVAQMVLCGLVNKEIVSRLSQKKNVKGAIGLSGLDFQLIKATQKDEKLGQVGEPHAVNSEIIKQILSLGLIPVIAPIGTDMNTGKSLNINADTAAGAVAEALGADVFILLTDIAGVLNKEKILIDTLPISKLQELKSDGTISGGMIPKLETAVKAIEAGVGMVSIADGRVEHCVLKALSGDAFGTAIVQ